jgi:tRNA (cytidine/uridine-2'-O-)-methyltransferase
VESGFASECALKLKVRAFSGRLTRCAGAQRGEPVSTQPEYALDHASRISAGIFGTCDYLAAPPRHQMRLALYEPDIPQNTGTILRLCACIGVEAHLIGPAGFPMTDRAFRRAGMDYLDQVALMRHPSWAAFENWRQSARLRLILFTTRAATNYLRHAFSGGDVLLFGRESAGVPDAVHAAADARLLIPMRPGLRSINVAMACAMALGEAMRQTGVPAGGISNSQIEM